MRGLGKYIRLSDQDDDCRPGEKTESNSVANQRLLLDQFIAMTDTQERISTGPACRLCLRRSVIERSTALS